jgi:aspartyl-tRNA(Asn)/glutamyl-tRNA(Gln) amidotransferase subunit A
MTPTDVALARIARHDPVLRAFTALDTDKARAAAAVSAQRIAAGTARALEGVPIGIKANIAVKGLATTAGVAARRDAIADADAAVVTLLREAGAVILGHLNMHEAALGATTDNAAYGRTENPHCIGRTPGGSSGGSGAAVAAGLCAVALGTDTLGSVRIPAAYNGVYGMKPTNGLVPDTGLVALEPRFDAIGPLAASVAELAAVMAVLAPMRAARPVMRVATLAAIDAAPMQAAVRVGLDAAVAAVRRLGVAVSAAPTPGLDLGGARSAGFIASARSAAAIFAADRSAGGISAGLARLFNIGMAATPEALAAGEAVLAAAAATLHHLLDSHDILLLPTAPQVAFAHGRAPVTQADFTAIANIAGLPALSLPSGVDDEGLPVAVQIIGRAGDDATVLAFAARLDAELAAFRRPAHFD